MFTYTQCFVEDAGHFINVILDCTNYLYRKCISLDCGMFIDRTIEMAAAELFESETGQVFNIVRGLFVAQNQ